MADNVLITPGAGVTIAADEVADATLGTVKVQYVKLMDGSIDGTTKATVGQYGLAVSALMSGVVSGTSTQATATLDSTGALRVNASANAAAGLDQTQTTRDVPTSEYGPQLLAELRIIAEILNEGLLSHSRFHLASLRTDILSAILNGADTDTIN